MPEPKAVVAVGICAATGGVFAECYNVSGGVSSVIPVDVYVPGCAAKPESIIDGVVHAIGILEEKNKAKNPRVKKVAAREAADAGYSTGKMGNDAPVNRSIDGEDDKDAEE